MIDGGGGNAPVSVSGRRVAFVTFGCKVNQYDSQAMGAAASRAGATIVLSPGEADVVVVNTCTVTSDADREARRVIRQLARRNPSASIVATGCYVEAAPEAVGSLPGVVRAVRRGGQPGLFGEARPATMTSGAGRFVGKTRAFLKLQDGCDYRCSFCIVPFARGPSRSRGIGEIVGEARSLVASGHKEIVVVGVALGSYRGEGGESFEDALTALLTVPGDFRIRISSLDPADVTPNLVGLLRTSDKLCPHLHLPIQSGDDAVLRAMRRRYRMADIRRVARDLQDAVPDVALSADVLVGFPGEDRGAFDRTLALVAELGFMRLHVFPYTERPGTVAAALPQIPRGERYARANEAIALSGRLESSYAARFRGDTVRVLVEQTVGATPGTFSGFDDHYVRRDAPASARPGEFVSFAVPS